MKKHLENSEPKEEMNYDNENVDHEFVLRHIRQLKDDNFKVMTYATTDVSSAKVAEKVIISDSSHYIEIF